MIRTLWIGAIALLLVAGCDQKTEAPAGAAGSSKVAATPALAAPPSGAAVAVKDDEIPTEADFEDEAEKDITADRLDAELDKLDKEIGQ